MTQRRIARALRYVTAAGTAALLLVSVFVGTAQAGSKNAKSDYCDVARHWSIHELASFDDSDPVAVRQYWGEYMAFVDDGERLAPKDIRDDWKLYAAASRKITPVLEKYGYDLNLLFTTGTDEEKAVFEPPADVQRAQDNVLQYEALVCGAGQPKAANVTFPGEKPGHYCELLAQDQENAQAMFAAGATPAGVKAYLVNRTNSKLAAQLIATAPTVIRNDVRDQMAWWEKQQRRVVERFGYDIRKLILDGSKKDRAQFQQTDKKIRNQFARNLAYQQQVCES